MIRVAVRTLTLNVYKGTIGEGKRKGRRKDYGNVGNGYGNDGIVLYVLYGTWYGMVHGSGVVWYCIWYGMM